jgi:hypothetical protein
MLVVECWIGNWMCSLACNWDACVSSGLVKGTEGKSRNIALSRRK